MCEEALRSVNSGFAGAGLVHGGWGQARSAVAAQGSGVGKESGFQQTCLGGLLKPCALAAEHAGTLSWGVVGGAVEVVDSVGHIERQLVVEASAFDLGQRDIHRDFAKEFGGPRGGRIGLADDVGGPVFSKAGGIKRPDALMVRQHQIQINLIPVTAGQIRLEQNPLRETFERRAVYPCPGLLLEQFYFHPSDRPFFHAACW